MFGIVFRKDQLEGKKDPNKIKDKNYPKTSEYGQFLFHCEKPSDLEMWIRGLRSYLYPTESQNIEKLFENSPKAKHKQFSDS